MRGDDHTHTQHTAKTIASQNRIKARSIDLYKSSLSLFVFVVVLVAKYRLLNGDSRASVLRATQIPLVSVVVFWIVVMSAMSVCLRLACE